MEQQFNHEALTKLKQKKRKKVWKRIVGVLMCIVVFCTTYMLILPAITKETKTYCGITEHIHEDACYRDVPQCQIHVHTDTCFADDGTLICTTPNDPEHTHTDICNSRELICSEEEHTHSLACLSDPTADLENEELWRATLPELTGIKRKDVVAIAKSQLGYAESINNYLVDADGNAKGYTRYGAWYGDPYGDWNAMFAAFCLRYAGAIHPYDASCSVWASALKEQELFKIPSEYVPIYGDIVFFDLDRDGTVDRVGLIETIENINFTTIEGDSENRVAAHTYDLFDECIAGYGIIDTYASEPNVEAPETQADTEAPETEPEEKPDPDINTSQGGSALADLVKPADPVTQTEEAEEYPQVYNSRTSTYGRSTFALRSSSTTYQATPRAAPLDLAPYINAVNMYDSKGNIIPNGSVVTEGDIIEFKIEYTVTGQQLGVMNGETVTVNSNTLMYKLPAIFEMVKSDSGNILNSSGQIVGTYVIDSENETISMTFAEKYVNDNANGMQIHGFISFFSTVTKITDTDDENQDYKFTDEITLGVTIKEEKEAVGDLKIEKNMVSVSGEDIIYEIKVTSKEGTKGPVTITDTMSKGLTFTEGISVKTGGGVNVSTDFVASSDKSSFTMTLPEMKPGDSYVVKYKCHADIDLLDFDMTVRNTATVTGKDSEDFELKDKVTVDHNFDMLKKTGKDNGDGTITWTISINQAKADISGWTLEDIITTAEGSKPYTGRVTILNSSGNAVATNVALPYTFPNGSTDTYTVTYTTSHGIADGAAITNKAILKDKDTEITEVEGVGVGTPITKTGTVGELTYDANGNPMVPITWTVTVDTTNGPIPAGNYFYDNMIGTWWEADMYMTYDQLMATISAVETELNRVGASIRSYSATRFATGSDVGTTYSMNDLRNNAACKDYLYERFSITLDKEVPQGQLLTFTYLAYGVFPNNLVDASTFKNSFSVSGFETEGTVKYSSGKLKATKYALKYYDPVVYKDTEWFWGLTDWNSTEGIGQYTYEQLRDSYLAWAIELSIPPGYINSDDIVIYEDLPEGVSLKGLKLPFMDNRPTPCVKFDDMAPGNTYTWDFTLYPADQYGVWNPQGGQPASIIFKVTEDGDLEITLPGKMLEVMGDLALLHSTPEAIQNGTAEWYGYLYIFTQINDDFEWTPRSEGSQIYVDSFRNQFTVTDEDGNVIDVGSQTQIITKDEREGAIRKEANTDSNNIINYSVIINAYGKDLIKNSEVLAVTDELTYTSTSDDPLRLRLVPGSVKLYEARLASDGSYTKLREVPVEYSYMEFDNKKGDITEWLHTIDMIVPDGKTLLLEYSYKANGEKNATHDVLNSCSISGVGEGSIDGDHKLEIAVKDATAQADTKGVMLYKVDADSDGIFLKNVKFNIYIWNEDEQDYIIVHHPNNGGTNFVTDSNGMIVLDTSTIANNQFAYNTAYYLVEVESPEGYFLGPERYYFYIANDDTVKYPESIPDNFTGRALVSGDIIYRKNVSELTKIKVEKYWQDHEGKSVTVTGQQVSSVTLELWQMIDGQPSSAKLYDTYTMTPDEKGNWSLTITGLPKAIKKSDSTKGTDYLYFIKEVGVGGYDLESSENNSGINSGTIKLTNRKTEGYFLPETGGIGTQFYTKSGLLLTLISTACLMKKFKKRIKENYDSP